MAVFAPSQSRQRGIEHHKGDRGFPPGSSFLSDSICWLQSKVFCIVVVVKKDCHQFSCIRDSKIIEDITHVHRTGTFFTLFIESSWICEDRLPVTTAKDSAVVWRDYVP